MNSENMNHQLTHLNEKGEARMVDVSEKDITVRTARAQAVVTMKEETLNMIVDGKIAKGDVFPVRGSPASWRPRKPAI